MEGGDSMRGWSLILGILFAFMCYANLTRMANGARRTVQIIKDSGSSAADYVQDGLVSLFDGEENAGWGLHADNPQTWVDLVGEDSIDKYGNSQSTVSDTWFNENALVGKPYFKNPKSSELYTALIGENRTIELSFTRTGAGSMVGFSEFLSGNWMNIAGFIGTRLLVYHEGNGFYIDPPSTTIPFIMTLTLSVNNGVCDVYVNGAYVTTRNSNGMAMPNNGRLFLGMNLNLVNDSTYFAIWTHSIRVYGKALSAEEVALNYKVDKARFGE